MGSRKIIALARSFLLPGPNKLDMKTIAIIFGCLILLSLYLIYRKLSKIREINENILSWFPLSDENLEKVERHLNDLSWYFLKKQGKDGSLPDTKPDVTK